MFNLKDMKKLALGILIFSLVLLSLASSVSAKTLVSGITYNSNFGATLADASVKVECAGGLTKNTVSLNGGIYGVAFDADECSKTSTIKVSASKGNLAGNAQGGIVACNGCDEAYLSIVNVVLTEQPQPPAGDEGDGGNEEDEGGDYFYLCGNGLCDSGENNNLCPQDCKLIENEAQKTSLSTGSSEPEQGEEGGNAGITGAAIGGGAAGMIIPIIFILAIILISVIIFVIRKRR